MSSHTGGASSSDASCNQRCSAVQWALPCEGQSCHPDALFDIVNNSAGGGGRARRQAGANPCGWGAHELGSLYVPLCQIVQARLLAQQPRLLP